MTDGKNVALVDRKYNTSDMLGPYDTTFDRDGEDGYGWGRDTNMRCEILGSSNNSSYETEAPDNTPTEPRENSLMAALPEDLRSVIRPMLISYYGYNSMTATIDYLPLLSSMEVSGASIQKEEENVQAQFDFYKNGNSKEKYRHSAITSKAIWWLRTRATNMNYYTAVSASGSVGTYRYYDRYGVAPMFLV